MVDVYDEGYSENYKAYITFIGVAGFRIQGHGSPAFNNIMI